MYGSGAWVATIHLSLIYFRVFQMSTISDVCGLPALKLGCITNFVSLTLHGRFEIVLKMAQQKSQQTEIVSVKGNDDGNVGKSIRLITQDKKRT